MRINRILMALMLACIGMPAYSQLQITSSNNAQALAQKLVGGGVTISNATITGHGFASAFFRNFGGNQLNVDSGIVLSTGRVQTSGLPGLNGASSLFASTAFAFPGDGNLNALVSPNLTEDAVFLEFDFVPQGDTIRFNYIFSSEEYPSFTCSNFNDVFAFFISGPGISGLRNIALVPGTNIPVAINSINSGTNPDLSGLCSGMGPGSPFPQYFVNNVGAQSFTHDGHTVVLTAMSPVTPCQTYHLKIAIADVTDDALDSAVFLEAESLNSNPVKVETDLPTLNGVPYMVEGCLPGSMKIIRSKKLPTAQPVNLVFAGNVINGTDIQTIPSLVSVPANDSVLIIPIVPMVDNIADGVETLKIYVSSNCPLSGSLYQDSLIIELRDYDTLNVTPGDSVVCNVSPIQLNATGSFTSIQWSPAAGLNNSGIANPLATPSVPTTYIATASTGDCHARDSVTLKIKSLQLVSTKDINCKNGTTGQIQMTGGGAWQSPAQFNINNSQYALDSVFSNLPVGTYTIRLKDGTGCVDSMQVTLIQAFPDLVLTDSIEFASCTGINGQVFINGSGGLTPYQFTVDAGNYSPVSNFNLPAGSHTLHLKDSNGCIQSKPINILTDPPINFTTQPNQSLCSGGTSGYIYIDANGGNGQYEYSIDGVNFQAADSFLVTVNNVNITVRDSKGCMATGSVNVPINQPVFVDLGADPFICQGSTYQFNAAYNASSLTWTANSTLSGTNIPNPVASPATTTTYYITAVKDVCIARDTVTVNVWPAPIADAGKDSTICYGKTINLTGSGGTGYLWLPASSVPTPNVSNPSVKPTQTTSYYLQVTDANGCKSLKYDTVKITLTPPIQAFAGNDTSVAIGQPLQLSGTDLGNSGASIYEWSPSFGLNDANIANPIATLTADMTYTLTMSTPEGCEGSDQVTIKVYMAPEIYVPTGFTPDGNGKNDLLHAIPVGIKKFNYFRVFNRWGQMVFATTTERVGWDGTIGGKLQSTGTYVWIVEGVDFKGNTIFRQGTTTLIR